VNGVPSYREFAPPAALREWVSCLWVRVGSGPVLVLPDACTDLIWQQGLGAFIAGPDTGPAMNALAAGLVMTGVRLRPGAGGPLLGLPLSALLNQRAGVADIGTGLASDVARRASGDLDPAAALRVLADAVGRAAAGQPADPVAVSAARLLGQPGLRAEQAAARLGLSERQLRRRCQAAVGYGPATLRRVLRFRRFVSLIDAGPAAHDLARLAAEAGYADQPHLSRECARLAGLTPGALIAGRCASRG
jgi:AraC-like DNA-binding protein